MEWLTVMTAVAAAVGTSGVLTFVQFLIKRKDEKNKGQSETERLIQEVIANQKKQQEEEKEYKRVQAEKIEDLHREIRELKEDVSSVKEQNRLTNDVAMASLRNTIYHLCKRWIGEKNTDPENMADMVSLVEPYVANGGDGIGDIYFNKYKDMYINNGGV